MLCSRPSFLRKQESRSPAPGCRITSGIRSAYWYGYNFVKRASREARRGRSPGESRLHHVWEEG